MDIGVIENVIAYKGSKISLFTNPFVKAFRAKSDRFKAFRMAWRYTYSIFKRKFLAARMYVVVP